jgi:hypothetical protein
MHSRGGTVVRVEGRGTSTSTLVQERVGHNVFSWSRNCGCEHIAGRNTVMTYVHGLGSRTSTCSSPSGEHAYCTEK